MQFLGQGHIRSQHICYANFGGSPAYLRVWNHQILYHIPADLKAQDALEGKTSGLPIANQTSLPLSYREQSVGPALNSETT
jgi:hypothetical protein